MNAFIYSPLLSCSLQLYERLIVVLFHQASISYWVPVDREWYAFSGWYGRENLSIFFPLILIRILFVPRQPNMPQNIMFIYHLMDM